MNSTLIGTNLAFPCCCVFQVFWNNKEKCVKLLYFRQKSIRLAFRSIQSGIWLTQENLLQHKYLWHSILEVFPIASLVVVLPFCVSMTEWIDFMDAIECQMAAIDQTESNAHEASSISLFFLGGGRATRGGGSSGCYEVARFSSIFLLNVATTVSPGSWFHISATRPPETVRMPLVREALGSYFKRIPTQSTSRGLLDDQVVGKSKAGATTSKAVGRSS